MEVFCFFYYPNSRVWLRINVGLGSHKYGKPHSRKVESNELREEGKEKVKSVLSFICGARWSPGTILPGNHLPTENGKSHS